MPDGWPRSSRRVAQAMGFARLGIAAGPGDSALAHSPVHVDVHQLVCEFRREGRVLRLRESARGAGATPASIGSGCHGFPVVVGVRHGVSIARDAGGPATWSVLREAGRGSGMLLAAAGQAHHREVNSRGGRHQTGGGDLPISSRVLGPSVSPNRMDTTRPPVTASVRGRVADAPAAA